MCVCVTVCVCVCVGCGAEGGGAGTGKGERVLTAGPHGAVPQHTQCHAPLLVARETGTCSYLYVVIISCDS